MNEACVYERVLTSTANGLKKNSHCSLQYLSLDQVFLCISLSLPPFLPYNCIIMLLMLKKKNIIVKDYLAF